MSNETYVVTGASGNIGKVLTETLLRNGHKVRVIGRSRERLQPLIDKGAQASFGSLEDAGFLTEAFHGAKAVFAMIPPSYAAEDYRKFQGQISDSLVEAIQNSGVEHVVALSSLGAHLPEGTGPIKGLFDFEQKLSKLGNVNILILRSAFFMENLLQGIPVIKSMGVNGSALKGDLAIPMIATRDIAIRAARAMEDVSFKGKSVQVLLGPRDVSMEEATRIIGKAIGNEDLKYVQVPYENVKQTLTGMGASESVADAIIEMSKFINSRSMTNLERNAESETPTTLEEFAPTFATAYRGGDAQAARNN